LTVFALLLISNNAGSQQSAPEQAVMDPSRPLQSFLQLSLTRSAGVTDLRHSERYANGDTPDCPQFATTPKSLLQAPSGHFIGAENVSEFAHTRNLHKERRV
jgi:hypothetical protein